MRLKKKFESGAATNYISRGRALKKLQLPLKDFRRLCILKGIYPREPLHRKKASKGATDNRVFYYAKDINFLASEPIINKLREYKVFLRRLTTAKAKREEDRVKKLYENRPEYQLDHIVKERYPTFDAAIRDLDDALCMLFAFAVLPHTKIITASLVASCRRLTAEFNHYIIESQSLTKVFISIKGIYFEAEVMGERVTWLAGHDRGVGHISEVDFSVMAIFSEFYVTMLQFVNFRLYQSIGLFYPPKIQCSTETVKEDSELKEEQVYSLACPLSKRQDYDEEQIDTHIEVDDEGNNILNEKLRDVELRKRLFANCRFWLNRETPKDPLSIVIRSCGGKVSWENCPAALYDEKDLKITHQIVDRPKIVNQNINRSYVQPQWVFDSFNLRKILPVKKYLPGALLPPHFSPFQSNLSATVMQKIEEIKSAEKKAVDNKEHVQKHANTLKKKKGSTKIRMRVNEGKTHKENKQLILNEQGEELKLREMMIPKKRRRVYAKMKGGIKRRIHEEKVLERKRLKLQKPIEINSV